MYISHDASVAETETAAVPGGTCCQAVSVLRESVGYLCERGLQRVMVGRRAGEVFTDHRRLAIAYAQFFPCILDL